MSRGTVISLFVHGILSQLLPFPAVTSFALATGKGDACNLPGKKFWQLGSSAERNLANVDACGFCHGHGTVHHFN